MQKINKKINIIEVKDVSFSYGSTEVLSGITFEVPKGDYLGVIGPNGAGKTTLLKIILGLITPDTGSVSLFGEDTRLFKERLKIGYVPQKITNFDVNFPVTVNEVVLMGRYAPRGLFHAIKQEDRNIAKRALEEVGMWEYKDRLIGDLSGGQQQRVFIARALSSKPEVIFLDEPTMSIDQKARDEFYALLKKLNEELQLTLVLISHDLDRILKEAKHIVCVDKTLVCHDLPDEFLKHNRLYKIIHGEIEMITHKHHH